MDKILILTVAIIIATLCAIVMAVAQCVIAHRMQNKGGWGFEYFSEEKDKNDKDELEQRMKDMKERRKK